MTPCVALFVCPTDDVASLICNQVENLYCIVLSLCFVKNTWSCRNAFLLKSQYLRLRALQRRSYTHYFYEATVGAGLPIISTLQGLLETGDKILKIEGIFRLVAWLSQLRKARSYQYEFINVCNRVC